MHGAAMVRRLTVLALTAAVVILGSSLAGWERLGWRDLAGAGFSRYWDLRLPRSLLAAVAGAGLAVGGVIFQGLFRNPLAEPYTLGLASGASLGAALGFLLWQGGRTGPGPRVLALVGALAALGLVWGISRLRRGRDVARLLLGGVCVAYLSGAGILLVFYVGERAITNEVVFWTMGSLGVLRPAARYEVLAALVPVLAYAVYAHRALDLLMFGEELAAARGVAVGRTIWTCYVLVGLLTAVIVANCGPIGFVGLMVPHMTRALVGVRTLPLVLGAVIVGAAFLAACDAAARSLPVTELPVGIVTNILGAGFFLYLLATRELAGDSRA